MDNPEYPIPKRIKVSHHNEFSYNSNASVSETSKYSAANGSSNMNASSTSSMDASSTSSMNDSLKVQDVLDQQHNYFNQVQDDRLDERQKEPVQNINTFSVVMEMSPYDALPKEGLLPSSANIGPVIIHYKDICVQEERKRLTSLQECIAARPGEYGNILCSRHGKKSIVWNGDEPM